MYESLILIDNDSEITIGALEAELRQFYSDDADGPSEITVTGSTISLGWKNYSLHIERECLPHVAEEAREIADQFGAAHPARERIAACTCRFATAGDDDPEMEHFNDYVFVGEALERLGTVYRFDQTTCEFE